MCTFHNMFPQKQQFLMKNAQASGARIAAASSIAGKVASTLAELEEIQCLAVASQDREMAAAFAVIASGTGGCYKKSVRFIANRASACRKSFAEFAAAAAKKMKSIFCRGVYLAENTYQAASVRVVRLRRTRSARGRLQNPVGKPQRGFSTDWRPVHCEPGVLICVIPAGGCLH